MSAPYAIEVRGLCKSFRRRVIRGGVTTFKTQLVGLLTGKRREKFEWRTAEVLKELQLQVPAGATVGIIGRNGSGKSTLLKILTGIYSPTSGTAVVRGRVSALLELGAGFHPEFSGRENVLINGVILGLSRSEVRDRLDEIIDFAELRDVIDEPVRTYSSGMYMRLAFSVATLVDPDVLIIDEILSVGDEHFSRKSRNKMEEFKARGKTMLLVTHDLATVERWCDSAVWLEGGRIAAQGDPREVVAAYRKVIAEQEAQSAPQVPAPPLGLEVSGLRVLDGGGQPRAVFGPDDGLVAEVDLESHRELPGAQLRAEIVRHDGLVVYGAATPLESPPALGVARLRVDRLALNDGEYSLTVAVAPAEGAASPALRGVFSVRSNAPAAGVVRLPCRWEIVVRPPAPAPVAASPQVAQAGT